MQEIRKTSLMLLVAAITLPLASAVYLSCCWHRARQRVFFWPNGALRVRYLECGDGKVVGLHQGWYSSGQRSYVVPYSDGRPNGSFVLWHSNGQVSCRGSMSNGLRIGDWVYWDLTGAVLSNIRWKEGKPWEGALPHSTDTDSQHPVLIHYQQGRMLLSTWDNPRRDNGQ